MKTQMEKYRAECEAFFAALWPGERRPLVFGDGNADRPVLMLIGEAPGQQEALLGKPFVGRAGKNLTEFLDVLHLQREDVYLSNTVKIRPTRPGKTGQPVNRPPTNEEIGLFSPWLMREIALVAPSALVTLGNVPLRALLGPQESIGQAHGRWRQAVVAPPKAPALTLPLFPLYHPASVIYRKSLLETYRSDLEALGLSLHPQK